MPAQEWIPYNLPRDKQESSRLESQHDLYVANTGYLLHPTIAATLPATAHIAEVATGTGIWLRSLAQSCPATWSFTGFDISDAQFPAASSNHAAAADDTSRCQFTLLDILQPIPEQFLAKFDVVHVRLLVCGLTGSDWETAAAGFKALLKPGGWLQWHESNFSQWDIAQRVPGASTVAMRGLVREAIFSQNAIGKVLPEDIEELKGLVERSGFVDCREDDIASDNDASTRGLASQIALKAFVALEKMVMKDGVTPGGWTEEKVASEAAKVEEEIEDGKIYFRWPMKIVLGRKP